MEVDHIIGFHHEFLEVIVVLGVEVGHLVDFSELAEGLNKLVSRAAKLGLEERKPEKLSVNTRSQEQGNLALKLGINNVFHIDLVEVVGPWMQHLEALILDVLLAVAQDVSLQEIERGLVGFDGVLKVVLIGIDVFVLAQECSDRFDTRRTLHVLEGDSLLYQSVHGSGLRRAGQLEFLENSHENRAESFEVPILVDDLMDDACLEDLVALVGEEEYEVVHVVYGLGIFHVMAAPLGQHLLAKKVDEVLEIGVLGEFYVLSGVLKAHLDLVHDARSH